MKKRSANCWLMQRKIVSAVATISAQRQTPCRVRTRVTSASARPPTAACGSSNTTFFGASAAVAAEDFAGPEEDTVDMDTPSFSGLKSCGVRSEADVHAGFGQRGGALLHPAVGEFLRIGRRVRLGEAGPGRGERFLTLEQVVVERLLVVAPGAGFLQRLDRALVHRDRPVLGLQLRRHAGRAGRAVLVGIVGF